MCSFDDIRSMNMKQNKFEFENLLGKLRRLESCQCEFDSYQNYPI